MFCGYIIRYLTLFGMTIIATYRKDNSSVTFLESSRMKGSARPDVMLQTLEDGLLAARTGELREKIAIWTILVNIHQPATPKLEEINALGKHLESLQHVLPIDVIRIWTNRLMIIKKESETRVTTALENVIDTYNTAWKKYFTQRTSLENGHLTEHLLPRKKLIDILELTTSNDMNPVDNVDWYYQYTLIEPIWSKDNELIYKAEIPLVSNTQYIHYVLNSWPVPVGNHTMQIDVNTEIALNTRDGDMFYPKACIGRNPTVCATGPVYNTEHEQCIRGIITGRRTDRNVCRVIIRKTVNKQSRITDLSLNEYIVIFHRDTNLILRCYGSREKSMKITKGVYKTKLKENCTLSCKTWKIKGIHKSIKKV